MGLTVFQGYRQAALGSCLYVHREVGGSAGTQFHPFCEGPGARVGMSDQASIQVSGSVLSTGPLLFADLDDPGCSLTDFLDQGAKRLKVLRRRCSRIIQRRRLENKRT